MWKQIIPWAVIFVVAGGGYKMWEREMKARGRAELELEQHAEKLAVADSLHAADSVALAGMRQTLAELHEARLADAEAYRALPLPDVDTVLVTLPPELRGPVAAVMDSLQSKEAACSVALTSCEAEADSLAEALALSEGMLARERISHRDSREALVTAVNLSNKRWHVGVTFGYGVTYNLYAAWNEEREARNRWASGPTVAIGFTLTF
jgi:hypothetical protein